MTEKLIRDGKVAVIVSPGFGAGWSTWNDPEDFCMFDAALCEAVERQDWAAAEARAKSVFGDEPYLGGLTDCVLEWVPEGALFYIHEYDGSERIVTDFERA